MEVGDLLINWNFENDSDHKKFISIDKLTKYNTLRDDTIKFQSEFYLYNLITEEYVSNSGTIEGNMCYLEDYLNNPSNYPSLLEHKKIIKELIKEFFDKYKVEGRKFKLNRSI
jgi:hypothetical protein